MSAPAAAALAPFAALLAEPGLRRTAEDLLAWIRTCAPAEDEARLARLVVTTTVYAHLCAPGSKWASERAYAMTARFTLLFFLVDDADLAELPALTGDATPWSIGRHTPALRAWLADFTERDRVSPRLRGRFDRAYHDYLESRRHEHAVGARRLGIEEHWAFRRRTIFMDPYLDEWLIVLGVDLDPAAEAAFAPARALAVDLVLLANDLGSAARDQQGGESPDDLNLLHTYARERGWSPADTLEKLIALYAELVGRYRAALPTSSAATPYADLLSGVVDGNVQAVRALQFRYPQVEAIVRRLPAVRP